MAVGDDSRYNATVVLVVRDSLGQPVRRPHLDIRERFKNDSNPNNRRYRVKDGDEWNLLGYRFLGDARHWWAIADTNNVVDPFEDALTPGARIQIPTLSTFNFEFLDFPSQEVQDGES